MQTSFDLKLLRHLNADPDLTPPELAEAIGSTPAKITRRSDKLTEDGVIEGRFAVINWNRLGYEVAVSLRVTLDKTDPRAFDEFTTEARKIPELTEIQTFLGRVDVRLSLIARDMAHYQELYRNSILPLPHIADIEALMTIATIKSSRNLPL